MNKQYILKTSEDDETIAYLYLPKHPKKTVAGIVKKSIHLSDLLKNLPDGTPDIVLDFDNDGDIIGLEFT